MTARRTTRWAAGLALGAVAAVLAAPAVVLGPRGALADPPPHADGGTSARGERGEQSERGEHGDAGSGHAARGAGARDGGAEGEGERGGAGTPASSGEASVRCHEQRAQPELIRSNYIAAGTTPEEHRERRRMRAAALRTRTERYGFFEGFGERSWNPHPPMHYAESTTFFGIPVRLNRRIIPAVRCAEQEIRRSCAQFRYRPSRLAGIRPNNSFGGGEVSNHVFGIALDIDPDRNPCCGCGGRFAEHPGCTRSAHTIYERMQMPECWIHAFERYGFYWLGNDHEIRDTMHFEFLGDPDRITE